MPERIQQIINQILDKWKSFSVRQKALIVSSTAVVITALAILGVVLSASKMVILKECDNTKEASSVKTLLEENGITPEISDDGLVFKVPEEDKVTAELLLAENNITPSAYEWENLDRVFEGGFSSTEADKTKRYKLWMQNDLAEKFGTLDMVDHVDVNLSIPNDDGTLVSRGEESSALLILTLNSEMSAEVAAAMGRATATALGNETTDKITIIDTSGNLLFAGGTAETETETANSNMELKSKAENLVAKRVKDVILGSELYSNASVSANLDFEFVNRKITDTDYRLPDGQETQLKDSERNYTSSGTGTSGGEPGTGSNDNTTYVMLDDNVSEFSTEEQVIDYVNSVRTTEEVYTVGRPIYESSSLSAVMTSYRIYNERTMQESGELEGMTFAEFEAQNRDRVRLEVDEDMVTMVANATGVPRENISLLAYEVPVFSYDDEGGVDIMEDILPIVLAALIILMLGFVVFRSTRREKTPEPELEPELSVEGLLESTKEAQEEDLDDIGFSEKSEIRVLIEKFVDENPEAAASLLRNWLNEEWE
ncbi:MAG: flagellar biosynthesis protein [Lachnospiraceae bacterium]|nr:flagellar biosynthesis protein [Lachnospiraceae bacterium]MCI9150254.1 flagellar biosynthesis protein [Lachnospiraceae bacterium]